ncbi:MAG: PilW family protein [Gammaproteobacteria bacterium]|nr:PilW family protein [Gammaproteobacteria bacterium]
MTPRRNPHDRTRTRLNRGFSLVELMVSIVIGLVILAAMVALFVNSSGANRELARANTLVENGRLAIELLESDVVHAGYWGSYMPNFDDQTFGDVPTDAPSAVPDPCLAYDTPWTNQHRLNLIGVPVNVYDSNTFCTPIVVNKQPTTDVLVVRHAELCDAITDPDDNCEDDIDGNVYFQASRCGTDLVRFRFGTVDDTTFDLNQLDCATPTEKRKFISNIYYIRDYAVTPDDGIPTLVRSTFTMANPGDVPAQQLAAPLIEGIEGFRVELGIDNRSNPYTGQPTGSLVNYAQAINWLDPDTRTTPTNRGDGSPDGAFIECTTATPCTAAQLMNVTAVKLYVLVRSREPAPNYTDTKTYQVGTTLMGPFNDGFKRHVYVSTLRLPNIAGRRQTP